MYTLHMALQFKNYIRLFLNNVKSSYGTLLFCVVQIILCLRSLCSGSFLKAVLDPCLGQLPKLIHIDDGSIFAWDIQFIADVVVIPSMPAIRRSVITYPKHFAYLTYKHIAWQVFISER